MNTCLNCDLKIFPDKVSVRKVKYCSTKCIKKYWYKNNFVPKHNPNYTCIVCNIAFVSKFKKDAKCCSKKCDAKNRYRTNEKHRIKHLEWIKNNPEKVRAYHRKNYANFREKKRLEKRLRSTANIRDKEKWINICNSQDNLCKHCKVKGTYSTFEVDHIIPFSKGGTNELNNLQALCSVCNKKKGNRFIG